VLLDSRPDGESYYNAVVDAFFVSLYNFLSKEKKCWTNNEVGTEG
jgi:hypothetical protein